MVLRRSAFGLFSGMQFPTLALMIEEQAPCCKMALPTEWLVKVKIKVLTTKDTKDHEGNPREFRPSCDFVSLVVDSA